VDAGSACSQASAMTQATWQGGSPNVYLGGWRWRTIAAARRHQLAVAREASI
jgi:hypothetical protein